MCDRWDVLIVKRAAGLGSRGRYQSGDGFKWSWNSLEGRGSESWNKQLICVSEGKDEGQSHEEEPSELDTRKRLRVGFLDRQDRACKMNAGCDFPFSGVQGQGRGIRISRQRDCRPGPYLDRVIGFHLGTVVD